MTKTHQECSHCGANLPYTLRYYAVRERGKARLRRRCKECDLARNRKDRANARKKKVVPMTAEEKETNRLRVIAVLEQVRYEKRVGLR